MSIVSLTFLVKPYQLDHPIGGTLKPLSNPNACSIDAATTARKRTFPISIALLLKNNSKAVACSMHGPTNCQHLASRCAVAESFGFGMVFAMF